MDINPKVEFTQPGTGKESFTFRSCPAKNVFWLTLFAHVKYNVKSERYGYTMIEEYMTIKDVANKWGLTVRSVQLMCANKRISGVTKSGNSWAIPVDAERPADGRVISGQYKNWRKNQSDRYCNDFLNRI